MVFISSFNAVRLSPSTLGLPSPNPSKALEIDDCITEIFLGQSISKDANCDTTGSINKNSQTKRKIQLLNGDVYEGEFVNGQMEGNGRLYGQDGSIKIGHFIQGCLHGKGFSIKKSGLMYEGDFVRGEFEGQGTLQDLEGNLYKGSFSNGKFHGFGVHHHLKKNVMYEGAFERGYYHGKGTCVNENRETYVGDFLNGVPHGKGKKTDESRTIVYEGDFVDGFMEGYGVISRLNEDEYRGQFKKGKWHGKGTYTNIKIKTSYTGQCADGFPDGQGKIHYPNGDVYEGQFHKGKKHGRGTLTTEGFFYEGDFVNDQMSGRGVWVFGNSSSYQGTFSAGLRNGVGTYRYDRVRGELTGNWKNDHFIAQFSDLTNSVVLSCLLDKTALPTLASAASLILEFLKKEQILLPFQSSLRSLIEAAFEPVETISLKIYEKLTHPQKPESVLLPFEVKKHAMILEIEPEKNGYLLRIFNTGDGLEKNHSQLANTGYYQTAFHLRVSKKAITQEFIANAIRRSPKPAEEVYKDLQNLPGAKKVDVPHPTFKKPQGGNNCSMAVLFSFFKTKLPYDEYKKLRALLFDVCSRELKKNGLNNPDTLHWLKKLEDKQKARETRANRISFV